MNVILLFILAALYSILCTGLVRRVAVRAQVVDVPGNARKIHTHPIPLLGGVGILGGIVLTMITAFMLGGDAVFFHDAHVLSPHLIGIFVGAFMLAIGGIIDDKYDLKPYIQILFPIAAVCAVIFSGLSIEKITNPLGGFIMLDTWKVMLPWGQVTSLWSDFFIAFWLLVAIYTTKFLDGLDGLVSGITTIGASIVALVSIFLFINGPTAFLAVIIAGAYCGFLYFNAHPARMFLGEAGSTLAGYFLGVLAIMSGAKVATALLILGIPVIDAALVISRRVFIYHTSPFHGDRSHIHFRLLDSGLSQRQAVWVLYVLSAAFGLSALFLQSAQKLIALLVLAVVMAILVLTLFRGKRAS